MQQHNAIHTAGPWIVQSGRVIQDGPDVWPKGDVNGIVIAHMDREESRTSPVERDANSHLMAAALDLLTAAEDTINNTGGHWNECQFRDAGADCYCGYDALCAAVDKALPS